MSTPAPKRLLFVCVENANRSQMAEAFARIHGAVAVEAFSAGSRPSGQVNPRAVTAMAELGYDLTRHASSAVTDLPDFMFDAVVTMGCGDACPAVDTARREDWSIPDPREMSPREFRRVRDLIESKVAALLDDIGVPRSSGAQREVPYTVVHAFTRTRFAGNPAGVCLLETWLPDTLMQRLAKENRHSETAFVVPNGDRFGLRWFTPQLEVDLCGHATLAAGVTLLRASGQGRDRVEFDTRSGPLAVWREGDAFAIDLPALVATPGPAPDGLAAALGAVPVSVLFGGKNVMAVFDTSGDVAALEPDFVALSRLDTVGVIATAPATEDEGLDFVSRYFAPRAGVDEDPVTGSAHCTLLPFWSERLGRRELRARQISPRGGAVRGTWTGDRCTIIGSAVVYSDGTIELSRGLVDDPAVVSPVLV